MMKIYKVGGCVRDQVLGIAVHDEDFVVVGSCEQEMLNKGYTRVGADFPVFLHPESKQEYALARQERKNAQGYLGFSTETNGVTLEQDLSRRDLTVNAMAQDVDSLEVVDPFNGMGDIQNKTLRHVGVAFMEDPVRVLRIGRFLAKFGHGWTVADETLVLISDMKAKGMLEELVGERIWKELYRGLQENQPQAMIDFFEKINFFETKAFSTAIAQRIPKIQCQSKKAIVNFATCFKISSGASWIPKEVAQFCKKVDILVEQVARTVPDRVVIYDKIGAFKMAEADLFDLAEAVSVLNPAIGHALVKDIPSIAQFNTKDMNFDGVPVKEIQKMVFEAKVTKLQET